MAGSPEEAGSSVRRSAPLLGLAGARAGYGGLPVLHGVSLSVAEGETVAVLGLNGAGKTTLLLTLAGVLPLWEGELFFEGEAIGDLSAPERVARGMALVPEGRHVFPGLTVEQNLLLGAWARPQDGQDESEALERAYGFFPSLSERSRQLGGTLSGGEQQMLAIARGLMSRPRMLLLDEASLGLAPVLVAELFSLVQRIAASGVTVLLVEQNVGVLGVVDRALIMQKGTFVYEGSGEELLRGEEIRRAYLGEVRDVR
jgi:branched-chain amino acid transport system ATP-binding protein